MTKDYWFTSDTHFFHENIIKYCNRPFSSAEEMNEVLIDNWNSVVKPGDIVYHLGDVTMGQKSHGQFSSLWTRLNGRKRLVVGNHDDVKYLASGAFFEKVMLWRAWNDKNLLFTHVPVHEESI
ncbi:MAG: metallophosphoesterase, partial [Bacteroidetes bacterium]|nr:metallophosphoesterase [Bacteroidota bacterium]